MGPAEGCLTGAELTLLKGSEAHSFLPFQILLCCLCPPGVPKPRYFFVPGYTHPPLTSLGASENGPLLSSCGDSPPRTPSRKNLKISHSCRAALPEGKSWGCGWGGRQQALKAKQRWRGYHNLTSSSMQSCSFHLPLTDIDPYKTLHPKLCLSVHLQRRQPTTVPFAQSPGPPCSQFPSTCIYEGLAWPS